RTITSCYGSNESTVYTDDEIRRRSQASEVVGFRYGVYEGSRVDRACRQRVSSTERCCKFDLTVGAIEGVVFVLTYGDLAEVDGRGCGRYVVISTITFGEVQYGVALNAFDFAPRAGSVDVHLDPLTFLKLVKELSSS